MNKKFFFTLLIFTNVFLCFSNPKIQSYNQIIYNDADFSVKIKLFNEEIHSYEIFEIPAKEITILPQNLSDYDDNNSKRLLVIDKDVYIQSVKNLSDKESIYVLKGIANRKSYEEENLWDDDFEEDNSTEEFIIEDFEPEQENPTEIEPSTSEETDFQVEEIILQEENPSDENLETTSDEEQTLEIQIPEAESTVEENSDDNLSDSFEIE